MPVILSKSCPIACSSARLFHGHRTPNLSSLAVPHLTHRRLTLHTDGIVASMRLRILLRIDHVVQGLQLQGSSRFPERCALWRPASTARQDYPQHRHCTASVGSPHNTPSVSEVAFQRACRIHHGMSPSATKLNGTVFSSHQEPKSSERSPHKKKRIRNKFAFELPGQHFATLGF